VGTPILVVNAGSSSIKYRIVDVDGPTVVCSGMVERVGQPGARLRHTYDGATTEREVTAADHVEGMRQVLAVLAEVGPDVTGGRVGGDPAGAGAGAGIALAAVGHRVVMGGGEVDGPRLVTDDLVARVERLSPLAPLHNPPNLAAIRVARELLPDVPHVAVFDTAFFHDLPAPAATYAIDRTVAEANGIRRYGFHGISHEYVSAAAADVLGRDLADLRQIVLHLGNGASASAVAGGRPVDTSMGLTPLEGLVMGTRGGDVDPGVLLHLARTAGMGVDDLDGLLNHRSGLAGLAGRSDMRDVLALIADGDPHARLAFDVYVHRLRKYVGAYTAVLGGLDALVFTAGVGENAADVRAATAEGLGVLGIAVDPDRNAAPSDEARVISPEGAPVAVLVVPTDEELAIARQAAATII
jgi:acetate kinase